MDKIDEKIREGNLYGKYLLFSFPDVNWEEVGLSLYEEWKPEEASSWKTWEQEAFGEGMFDALGKFLKEA